MSDLGFLPAQLEKLRYCYTQPYGCLLVTGPTGSGKSTTLYGAVNEINDVEKNIITVEDPVEYRLKGINQVQVNIKAGLTFAAALKSILRCDPDIVMIGEMRDHETASIGIEAALTGHLVLSTLHTNTAPGAVTRLTEMGIEPYLVSSSVLGVLAQRLARRLCKCKEEYTPDARVPRREEVPRLGARSSSTREPFTLRKPGRAASAASGKGYKGRMGLHEVMLMSEEIAKLAIAHASAEEIEKVAIAAGHDHALERRRAQDHHGPDDDGRAPAHRPALERAYRLKRRDAPSDADVDPFRASTLVAVPAELVASVRFARGRARTGCIASGSGGVRHGVHPESRPTPGAAEQCARTGNRRA